MVTAAEDTGQGRNDYELDMIIGRCVYAKFNNAIFTLRRNGHK